jgi:hypothetical protein
MELFSQAVAAGPRLRLVAPWWTNVANLSRHGGTDAKPQAVRFDQAGGLAIRFIHIRRSSLVRRATGRAGGAAARVFAAQRALRTEGCGRETRGGLPASAFVLAAPPTPTLAYAHRPFTSSLRGHITNMAISVSFQSGSGGTAKVGANTTCPLPMKQLTAKTEYTVDDKHKRTHPAPPRRRYANH